MELLGLVEQKKSKLLINRGFTSQTPLVFEGESGDALKNIVKVEELVVSASDALVEIREILTGLATAQYSHPGFVHRECKTCGKLDRIPSSFLVLQPDSDPSKIVSTSNFNGGPGNCAKKVATRKLRQIKNFLNSISVSEEEKKNAVENWNIAGIAIYESLLALPTKTSEMQTLLDKPLVDHYFCVGGYQLLTIFKIAITRSWKNFMRIPRKALAASSFSVFINNLDNYTFMSNNHKKVRIREQPGRVFTYNCFMTLKERTHVIRQNSRSNAPIDVWVSNVFKDRTADRLSKNLPLKDGALKRLLAKYVGILHRWDIARVFGDELTVDTISLNSGGKRLTPIQVNRLNKTYCATIDVREDGVNRLHVTMHAPKMSIPYLKKELTCLLGGRKQKQICA